MAIALFLQHPIESKISIVNLAGFLMLYNLLMSRWGAVKVNNFGQRG